MDFLMKRDDIQPVILGGDMSTYSLAREFYEAFGVTSIVIGMDAISVIKKSRFVRMHIVENNGQASVEAAICQIAGQAAGKKVLVIANTDDRVELIENIQDRLPANVVCPLPPHDLMSEVSDKVRFQQLCESYGLDVPQTQIVSLAGSDPIEPTNIPFPLIAKPAASSEYNHFIAQGFQKIYFMHEQAELDRLWAALREAGFGGEFLVQELIEGDDTYMDSLTIYMSREGKATMLSGAHVLLEDHAPTLFGNPVAMITKPMPDLWEKAVRLLQGIGWYGFANIDIKRDPKTGRKLFLDLNPRVGANSFYSAAAGVNPMYVLVRDVIDGDGATQHRIDKNVLYHRVPVSLARRYVRDPELLSHFDAVVAAGQVANPSRCKADTAGSRFAGLLMEKNFIRKFAKFYPEPTDTSF